MEGAAGAATAETGTAAAAARATVAAASTDTSGVHTAGGAGRLLLLREVQAQAAALDGTAVRVHGRIAEADVVRQQVLLQDDDGTELVVDTRLLGAVELLPRGLVGFIGEVETNKHTAAKGAEQTRAVLVARVSWRADGLDVNLYAKALGRRRQLLSEWDAAAPVS